MKERMKGLILGAALTAAAFGLTFTAAADRSIQVDDDDIGDGLCAEVRRR